MSQAGNEQQREEFALACLPTVITCADWTINLWGQLIFNSGKKPISEPTQLSRAATQARIGTKTNPGNNSNNGQPIPASRSTFSKAGLELINRGLATRTRKITDKGFTDGTGTPFIWTPTLPNENLEPTVSCEWESLYPFLTGLFRRKIVLTPHYRAAAVKLACHLDSDGQLRGSQAFCAALDVSRFPLCLEPLITLAATNQLKISFDIQAKGISFKSHEKEVVNPEQIEAEIDELREQIWYPDLLEKIVVMVARTRTEGRTVTPKQKLKMHHEMIEIQEKTSAPLLEHSIERMLNSKKNIAAWSPYLKAIIRNNTNSFNNQTPAVTNKEKTYAAQSQAREILHEICQETQRHNRPKLALIAKAVNIADQLAQLNAGTKETIEQNILLAIKRGSYDFKMDRADQMGEYDLDLVPEYEPGMPWSTFRKSYCA